MAAAAGFVLLTALLPFLALLGGVATDLDRSTALTDVQSVFRLGLLLLRSLGLASAVTCLALLIGVPLGFLLGRTDVPWARAALLLHLFPLFLPPFLLSLGWFHLFGALFSAGGLIMVETLAFTPVVTTFVALGLQGMDPALEDAARVIARPIAVARQILIPAVSTSVAVGGLVVFALAFSELGVPAFLRVDCYPLAVFSRLGGIAHAPGEAVALVLPLLAIALALLALERRIARHRPTGTLGLRIHERARLPLEGLKPAGSLLVWGVSVAGILPLLGLLAAMLRGRGFTQLGDWLGDGILNSLLPAAAAATVLTGLTAILGPGLARGWPGARFLDAVLVLAFVTPATVLGVGLIGTWNRPDTQLVYSTMAILVVGYCARYAILPVRILAAATAQEPAHLDEAAAVAGAGVLRRLGSITLPLHRRALAAGWLLALVFCLRDLDGPILYYPAGKAPLLVRIFTLEANGPRSVVAALALVQVCLVGASLWCALLLVRHRRPSE